MTRVESTSLRALGPNSHHRSGSAGRCERIGREAALSGGTSWELLAQALSVAFLAYSRHLLDAMRLSSVSSSLLT